MMGQRISLASPLARRIEAMAAAPVVVKPVAVEPDPVVIQAEPDPAAEAEDETPPKPVKPSARKIVRDVAKSYGVTFDDIMGDCRTVQIAAARHEAVAMVAKIKGWNLCEIGRFFDRDHTTIINSLSRYAVATGQTVGGYSPELGEARLTRIKRNNVGAVARYRNGEPA